MNSSNQGHTYSAENAVHTDNVPCWVVDGGGSMARALKGLHAADQTGFDQTVS